MKTKVTICMVSWAAAGICLYYHFEVGGTWRMLVQDLCDIAIFIVNCL
jgi:hypothetical protein